MFEPPINKSMYYYASLQNNIGGAMTLLLFRSVAKWCQRCFVHNPYAFCIAFGLTSHTLTCSHIKNRGNIVHAHVTLLDKNQVFMDSCRSFTSSSAIELSLNVPSIRLITIVAVGSIHLEHKKYLNCATVIMILLLHKSQVSVQVCVLERMWMWMCGLFFYCFFCSVTFPSLSLNVSSRIPAFLFEQCKIKKTEKEDKKTQCLYLLSRRLLFPLQAPSHHKRTSSFESLNKKKYI